jgi:hypothetical protein
MVKLDLFQNPSIGSRIETLARNLTGKKSQFFCEILRTSQFRVGTRGRGLGILQARNSGVFPGVAAPLRQSWGVGSLSSKLRDFSERQSDISEYSRSGLTLMPPIFRVRREPTDL